ncbi:hypothetical protein ACA910_016382 [Epithemia clementina (nom. ined.)]
MKRGSVLVSCLALSVAVGGSSAEVWRKSSQHVSLQLSTHGRVGHKKKLSLSLHSKKTRKSDYHHNHDAERPIVWNIPRGGSSDAVLGAASAGIQEGAAEALKQTNLVVSALQGLHSSIANGPKGDALMLLGTTAFNTPICQKIGLSPILGFLSLGILFGPNGLNLIRDIHTTEMLADIGIVFFLFEMGIHLSLKTLMRMRNTVFGLGGSQFAITALVVGIIATLCGMSPAAATILGGGLALSSSAFVLQLLKDKKQLATVYGESSFGVLLLQDLMVVPLLVITPILAGNGGGLGRAILSALVQLTIALTVIGLVGMYLVTPLYNAVAAALSQEALVGLIMLNVLGMSFLTEGLGLSNTLGPFLAGVLLAENKHVHEIEKEASPIRGILVGLFFFTVGFEIDLKLIASNLPLVTGLVGGLLVLKTFIAGALGQAFGLDFPTARRLGLVLSQGGEFAFVAFRMARSFGILDEKTTKIMLTVVSLTMAFTPTLEGLGESLMVSSNSNKKPDDAETATTTTSPSSDPVPASEGSPEGPPPPPPPLDVPNAVPSDSASPATPMTPESNDGAVSSPPPDAPQDATLPIVPEPQVEEAAKPVEPAKPVEAAKSKQKGNKGPGKQSGSKRKKD